MAIQLNLTNQKQAIILYSGGLGSFCAAWLEIEKKGLENCILYFNDTLVEDADLYRFLVESVCWFHKKRVSKKLRTLVNTIPDLEQEQVRKDHLLELGNYLDKYCSQFHYDPDGRSLFDIFYDQRYLGNSRVDPCSRVLKRERSAQFVKQFSPDQVEVVVGMDWSEIHRLERAIPNWLPYTIRSPMCPQSDDDTNWQPRDLTEQYLLKLSGIKKPSLYNEGFPHNNCSGFCVKAGLAQFKLLWEKRPSVYAYFERKQEELHRDIPSTRPFLRMTGKRAAELATVDGVRSTVHEETGKLTVYLTLRQYRELVLEVDAELGDDKYDFGGCACAI